MKLRSFKRAPRGISAGLVVLALATSALYASSVAGASTSSAKKCNGPEIKVMNVTNLSFTQQTTVPELPNAIKAAAKNITDTCQLGGPVTVLSCDDKFNANDASACARDAVAQKVLALVGTYGSWGDAMLPIVSAAGIPSIGNNTNGVQESNSPFSFGTFQPPVTFSGYFTTAASVGAKKAIILYLDLPSVKFFVDLGKAQAAKVGMTVVDTVPIPVTATDMAQFAARVPASGADAIMFVLGPGQIAPIVKNLVQSGVDLKGKTHIYAGLNTITPNFVKQLGTDATGIISPGTAWSPDDTKNPGIQRFLKELKKAGLPHTSADQTVIGVNGWAAMHMIADVLEGAPTKDSATLIAKLNSAGPLDMNKYGSPNLDFAKNSYPESADLSKLRIFVDTISVFEVNAKGKMVPLYDKFVSAKDVNKKLKLLKLG